MQVNGLELHVDDQGDGAPVLLLHGWPDSSRLWRGQVPVLNKAGLRTIAPDMRGFGESDKPSEVGAYAFSTLRHDVLSIMDELDIESAHIVGHDWGAALAWSLAINEPTRVNRLVAISAPHEGVPSRLEQHEKFWYQLLFMFEGTAEDWLQHDDWKFFREFTRNDGDTERYVADLSRPGALTASLNIYRANARPRPPTTPRNQTPVSAPTMVIWPSDDHYLVEDRLIASTDFVDAPSRYVRLDDSSHWAPLDATDQLNSLILEWLTEKLPTPSPRP